MRWKMQRHAEVYFLPAFPKKVLQPICLVEPASKHLHRACKMTQAAWVPAEFAHIDPQLVQVLKSHQNKSVNTTFVHFCAWFSGISIMCVLSFVWLNLFSQSVSLPFSLSATPSPSSWAKRLGQASPNQPPPSSAKSRTRSATCCTRHPSLKARAAASRDHNTSASRLSEAWGQPASADRPSEKIGHRQTAE